MKLRTTHNSIRIRIRKSELSQLAENGNLEEHIQLGNKITFSFGLQISESAENLKASLQNNELRVSIPKKEAQQWITTGQVGMEYAYPVSDTEKLNILIEKDFPCPDRPGEDKSDTFWEIASKKEDKC